MNNSTIVRMCKGVICFSFILCFALTVFTVPLQSQQTTLLQEVQSMNLPVAKGKVTVYYASGYEKRVAEVRPLVEDGMEFYERKLNVKQEFSVAILSSKQWTKHIQGIPYGLPFVSDNIAVLPATNDGVITAGAIAMKPNISATLLKKIEQSCYDFETGAMKFTDLIALHELGHVYTPAYGIKSPTKWFHEFLAQYVAYAFLKEKHPKLADLFQAMATEVYIEGLRNPQHTSLEDFEHLYTGVGADNYAWYQGMFLQKAAQIYDVKKLTFLADVKRAFPLDEKGEITPEISLGRLEKISPGITAWSKSFK